MTTNQKNKIEKGKDVIIHPGVVIKRPELVKIGNHVAISNNAYISCAAEIGDYTHISPNTSIIGGANSKLIMKGFNFVSANSVIVCGSDNYKDGLINPIVPQKYRKTDYRGVTFELFSGIGANSTVLPGVTLAVGSTVGANSLLTKDTEPWTVYAGCPARPVAKRDKELILQGYKELGYEFDEK